MSDGISDGLSDIIAMKSLEPKTIDIHRTEMRFSGDLHDINRLLEACKETMANAEATGEFGKRYVVHIDVPADGEL